MRGSEGSTATVGSKSSHLRPFRARQQVHVDQLLQVSVQGEPQVPCRAEGACQLGGMLLSRLLQPSVQQVQVPQHWLGGSPAQGVQMHVRGGGLSRGAGVPLLGPCTCAQGLGYRV